MKIIVNGEAREVAGPDLAAALEELGYGEVVVATAINEGFVPVAARVGRRLSDGDVIEVLAPMQGG